MMRPITCLSLVVAMGAGLYLYQEKHRAQLLDREIMQTVKQVEQARTRIGLLKAEKAVMEEPQRLAALVAHHLTLQPLAPAQFVRLDDLPGRLPPPVAEPAAMAMASPPPFAAAMPVAPPPDPAPDATPVATLLPAHPPALPHPPPRAPKPNTVVTARIDPAPAPRQVFAPVLPAYVPTTVAVHAPTIQNASATAPAVPSPYPSYVGSALGTSRTSLPPPVPAYTAPGGSSLASATSLGYAASR